MAKMAQTARRSIVLNSDGMNALAVCPEPRSAASARPRVAVEWRRTYRRTMGVFPVERAVTARFMRRSAVGFRGDDVWREDQLRPVVESSLRLQAGKAAAGGFRLRGSLDPTGYGAAPTAGPLRIRPIAAIERLAPENFRGLFSRQCLVL